MNQPDILAVRQSTHGDFSKTAFVAQELKHIVRSNGENLTVAQFEALDMICVKVARILSGDPSEPDHWRDIAGYARLGAGDRG